MALEAKLVQKLSQQLLMTPQLQQAIKLLQLGRLEYLEAIEKELLENPVLEDEKEPTVDGTQEEQPTDQQVAETSEAEDPADTTVDQSVGDPSEQPVSLDYLEAAANNRDAETPRGTYDFDDRPSLEATLTKSESLYEHIIEQLRMQEITALEEFVAVHIIGNLDKNGYLCSSAQEIATTIQQPVEVVERVIQLIQRLDPPGVAARDLKECLLIQLDNLGLKDQLEGRIVEHHLEKIEKQRPDQIAKEESVPLERVIAAVNRIRTLEPRPGRPFNDESIRYIVPDIYVHKVGGEFVITLNEEGMPRLRVSPYYLELLKRADTENLPNRNYLTERLKAASWLIKSMHQRQSTIYRVTQSIVKFQREFFEYGIEKMKPLVLKDVAEDIGMHESTVSRVTTNKYVHTPQGVFELKFFFSNGIRTSGGDVSSSSVKEKIKNIIAAESQEKPISDQEIVELLGKENIQIARRTVAKYRENLGIMSSSKRKKVF